MNEADPSHPTESAPEEINLTEGADRSRMVKDAYAALREATARVYIYENTGRSDESATVHAAREKMRFHKDTLVHALNAIRILLENNAETETGTALSELAEEIQSAEDQLLDTLEELRRLVPEDPNTYEWQSDKPTESTDEAEEPVTTTETEPNSDTAATDEETEPKWHETIQTALYDVRTRLHEWREDPALAAAMEAYPTYQSLLRKITDIENRLDVLSDEPGGLNQMLLTHRIAQAYSAFATLQGELPDLETPETHPNRDRRGWWQAEYRNEHVPPVAAIRPEWYQNVEKERGPLPDWYRNLKRRYEVVRDTLERWQNDPAVAEQLQEDEAYADLQRALPFIADNLPQWPTDLGGGADAVLEQYEPEMDAAFATLQAKFDGIPARHTTADIVDNTPASIDTAAAEPVTADDVVVDEPTLIEDRPEPATVPAETKPATLSTPDNLPAVSDGEPLPAAVEAEPDTTVLGLTIPSPERKSSVAYFCDELINTANCALLPQADRSTELRVTPEQARALFDLRAEAQSILATSLSTTRAERIRELAEAAGLTETLINNPQFSPSLLRRATARFNQRSESRPRRFSMRGLFDTMKEAGTQKARTGAGAIGSAATSGSAAVRTHAVPGARAAARSVRAKATSLTADIKPARARLGSLTSWLVPVSRKRAEPKS